jgi:hypothetical protein
MSHNRKGMLLLAAFAMALAISTNALAGSYQTIEGVPNSGAVALHVTPRNQGAAAEATVIAWNSVADSFRCGITQNSTGRALNLVWMGVNGTIISSCTTAINGTCNTGTFGVVGGLEFQCLVYTQNGQPVLGANPHFTVEVRRP